MRDRRDPSAVAHPAHAGGFLLIWVLVVASLLSSAAGIGLMRSAHEKTASDRFADSEQAFQLAEAGVDRALPVLRTSGLSWNDELVGADGVAGTSDDGVLSFDLTTTMPPGTYTVRVLDNADDAPAPNNPTSDTDGVVRIVSSGTTLLNQRLLEVALWGLFNHAIAAEVDILLRQASAMGNIHANRNIEVRQTSELFGCSQATASGTFCFGGNGCGETDPNVTLVQTCGDLVGGDPRINFFRPDAAVLRAAATFDIPDWRGTIGLNDGDIAGYERPLGVVPDTPQTVSLNSSGTATIVMFDGHSIRFRDKLGTIHHNGTCQTPINLSIIAIGGGSITFEQPVCLRGLIWAEGDVTIAQDSTISGAVVSAGGTVDVKQESSVTFNRSVIASSLIPAFSGATLLSWQEQ